MTCSHISLYVNESMHLLVVVMFDKLASCRCLTKCADSGELYLTEEGHPMIFFIIIENLSTTRSLKTHMDIVKHNQ